MTPPNSVPLWMHVLRISVLSAAVVGIAWIVLSAQRRAMQARAAAQAAEEERAAEALAMAPDFDMPAPALDFDAEEADLSLPEVPHARPMRPAAEREYVPVTLENIQAGEWPPLSLEVPAPPAIRLPELRFESPIDRYIGSSKAAVLSPDLLRPVGSKERHGKP